jgi:rRNA maturation protein Nop10
VAKKEIKANKCNICGGPTLVAYMEKNDDETGKVEERKHFIPCLGHSYIRPHLWNKHPEYDKYRMFHLKQRKNSGVSNE